MVLVGCGEKAEPLPNPDPAPAEEKLIADPIVEKAVRKELKKPTGELTKADFEKVDVLELYHNQLTELPKGLEKLTQIRKLYLDYNQLTSVKGLEKLTQLTQLEFLELSDNDLTSVKGLENLMEVTSLGLYENKLTSVKGLENLSQLEYLSLHDNPDLTKGQIAEIRKALPKCEIPSSPIE